MPETCRSRRTAPAGLCFRIIFAAAHVHGAYAGHDIFVKAYIWWFWLLDHDGAVEHAHPARRRDVATHLIHLLMRQETLMAYRRRLLSAAEGDVLEIGIGSGLNLPLYGERVTHVFGI